ncbi:MAG: hypothetical protein KDD67_06595 [Ignavibacteriae bacterium]|nr:hypothetical protein [Ignavibacteriota bacterium]MCB9215605.1 hypothetical protein [Ignavibacteria bacterium]
MTIKQLIPARTIVLLTLLALGCGSSEDATLKNGGIVTGIVQQVLHHGAYNPDGPNKTITLLNEVTLVVNDSEGEIVAKPTTNTKGEFRLILPAGSYVVIPPDLTGSDVPSSAPSPERIEVKQGDSLYLNFTYAIYAP